ncbi:MAG: glycosyltransferase family 2 protein [Candidatus Omnitrophica bacterium]|nr:glycosyltransferase family 2 protein [Candidatus Omnitrophota bacterium]
MADRTVDIIIPVFNEAALTKNCLESIVNNSDTPYHLILIDNASGEETRKCLEEFVRTNRNSVLIRNGTNLGWVKAVNQGINMSSGPYICIMNNDTVVRTPGWLYKLIAAVEANPGAGLVNPRFETKNAAIAERYPYIEIDFCRGYCVLIKRAVIDKIGGLDEAYGLGYYDDDDFSVRAIRANFRCIRANDIVVEHIRDSTFSTVFKDKARRELHEKNKQLFYSKWGRRLRIVFIVTKTLDKERLKDVLLLLARRQHIVYLWNLAEPLGIRHINIRERIFPKIFPGALLSLTLFINSIKKEAKRYNLVFVDNPGVAMKLSGDCPAVHCVDVERGADRVCQIADSAAKDTR